ncbi:hypothetical protein HCG48_17195 [Oxynema aestuarii AP17]|uniref:Uncharacterized protein n=1 Tax=Oxynema aestuarii AP17 TaxID=2064643 RepID=A0A6H1U0B4_9CYAN|nr:hypothetical protein HCG48_17195 [Oxynema aestuarii AP17]RMH71270.1 MAG: hypothetical protein D6680_22025 [Cyanobacteria bacterium J007]
MISIAFLGNFPFLLGASLGRDRDRLEGFMLTSIAARIDTSATQVSRGNARDRLIEINRICSDFVFLDFFRFYRYFVN